MKALFILLFMPVTVFGNCYLGAPESANMVLASVIKDKETCIKECNIRINQLVASYGPREEISLIKCRWNAEEIAMKLPPIKPTASKDPKQLLEELRNLDAITYRKAYEKPGKLCAMVNAYYPKHIANKAKHSNETNCRSFCEEHARDVVKNVKPNTTADNVDMYYRYSCVYDGKIITYESGLPAISAESEAKVRAHWSQLGK